MAYDIGDQSRAKFAEVIAGAKTIVMGGPMGVIEESMFQGGTFAIFDAISQVSTLVHVLSLFLLLFSRPVFQSVCLNHTKNLIQAEREIEIQNNFNENVFLI